MCTYIEMHSCKLFQYASAGMAILSAIGFDVLTDANAVCVSVKLHDDENKASHLLLRCTATQLALICTDSTLTAIEYHLLLRAKLESQLETHATSSPSSAHKPAGSITSSIM